MRPHVFAFYNFARAADDIADTPDLSPEEKIHHLDHFENILLGKEPDAGAQAAAMRDSLAVTGCSPRHCLDLLAAFKQDAVKKRYRNWAELIAYCRLSAAPVGRHMIDLHGGPIGGYGPSDALCIALQIINHMQDFGDDYRILNRIYLPGDWLAEAGVSDRDLAAEACTPSLRRVLDWTLGGVDGLLADCRGLVATLNSARLGVETAVIIAIAVGLSGKLADHDPLSGRVALDKAELAVSVTRGILSGVAARLWRR